MARLLAVLIYISTLLNAAHGFRFDSTQIAQALNDAEETDQMQHLSHQNVSFKELVGIAEGLNMNRARPYRFLKVASSPASTACSWWWKDSNAFYRQFGSVCGVQGVTPGAIDMHIERVWGLISSAHQQLSTTADSDETLKIFTLPEWALGRRYPNDGSDYAPPLDFDEMQHIILELSRRLTSSGLDFTHWLLVPGSIYWGVKVSTIRLTNGARYDYAVFNTAPVFYGGNLAWAHNKKYQADNLHTSEVWVYEFVKTFPSTPPCTEYGKGGRICGTRAFQRAVAAENGEEAANALQNWGLTQPVPTILVNGLAIGIDICLDHRQKLSLERLQELHWLEKFDIQLLVSSGMGFSIVEEDGQMALMIRQGGIAVASDGIYGPDGTHMYQAMIDGDNMTNQYGQKTGHKIKLHLNQHFQKLPSTLIGSWTHGCHIFTDAYNRENCDRCRLGFGTQSQGHKMFCDTQAGNWNILHVWSSAVRLPATNINHHKSSNGIAVPFNATGSKKVAEAKTYAGKKWQMQGHGRWQSQPNQNNRPPAFNTQPTTRTNLCPDGAACFFGQRCYYVAQGYTGMNPTSCQQQYKGIWCPQR